MPRVTNPAGPHLEKAIELLVAAEGNLPAVHVINSGVSGEYIQRLFDSGRYERDAAKLPGIDFIFIRYGLNDRGRRENFRENFPKDLRQLISRLRVDHPQAKIVLMTVIPYASPAVTEEINSLVRTVADQEKLPVFDLVPAYTDALNSQGGNALNYRRYPLAKVPESLHEFAKPYVHGDTVLVMGNDLDAILGHLPGWYQDRHPNLAGYHVIAAEMAKYLKQEIPDRPSAK